MSDIRYLLLIDGVKKGLDLNDVKMYLVVWFIAHGHGHDCIDEVYKRYMDLYVVYKLDQSLLDHETLEFMKHYELFIELGMHLKQGEK